MKYFFPTTIQKRKLADCLAGIPYPSVQVAGPNKLLKQCPKSAVTYLSSVTALSELCSVADVMIKDERIRMGLGSFKALGAAYVIARDAANGKASGQTYVTASAGNHGLSVAAGASVFGANAVVILAETVPESFAERLRQYGANVMRAGAVYEESMAAAVKVASDNDWILLSDSSWDDYVDVPRTLMEGYLVLMHEAAEQLAQAPTHIFLQAGVGGLAAACATYARKVWGEGPTIAVVEPEWAPALFESVRLGDAQLTEGPSSAMGRLDCKEPSLIALKGLARDADIFMLISEDEGERGADICAKAGFATTPSGAAGVAGLLAAQQDREAFGLDAGSRVLVILSEEA